MKSVLGIVAVGAICAPVYGAIYRVVPAVGVADPGQVVSMHLEVETEAGDNLVGVGHFSFAINLAIGGDAGGMGSGISTVTINIAFFDDVLSNDFGTASGALYSGVAGVTTDVLAPNQGSQIGDVLELFTFDFAIPLTAAPGQFVSFTPSEGILENLTVNDFFDPVSPQRFEGAILTVVPMPSGLACFGIAGIALCRRRRRISADEEFLSNEMQRPRH